MKKKITFSVALSYIFVAMTLTFCLTMILSARLFETKVSSVTQKESMYEKLSDVDKIVRQHFLYDIDDKNLYDNLAAGYIAGLNDGEAKYYSAAEVNALQNLSKGKVIGIGTEIVKDTSGYVKIVKVHTDSPADVAEIKKGDIITNINDVDLKTVTTEEARHMLSGEAGTTVDIVYLRDGKEEKLSLMFKIYDVPAVTYSIENKIGYIKISNFTSNTVSDVDYAINSFTEAGVTSLCIDIRNNKSIEYYYAAQVADLLVKEGTIMQATYKDGTTKVMFTSDKAAVNVPIVVIANGSTGYAAEMFGVILKDMSSAKFVGTKTMGKGTIQSLYRLPDGSGIDITTAKLVPPTTVYDQIGIIPDYEKTLEKDQELNFYDLTMATDPQIQRAFEVASNRNAK